MEKKNESGLTLVELMVSMVILGFAISAAFAFAYTMLGGFADNERVLRVERAARGGLDIIADALRTSSPGVTTGAITDLAYCSGSVDAITVENDVGAGSTDAVTIVHASGGVLGFLQSDLLLTSTTVTINASNADFQGSMFFEEGDLLVVTNGTNGHLLLVESVVSGPSSGSPGDSWVLQLGEEPALDGNVSTGQVGNLCANTATGTVPFTNPGPDDRYPAGSLVVRARRSRFSVCDVGNTPYLVMNDWDDDCDATDSGFEPVAEGIEDIQFAVAVDDGTGGANTAGDSDIGETALASRGANDDEVYYNFAGESAPPTLTTTPWTALRVNVVARSVGEVSDGPTSARPALEDHASGTMDEFRRRSLSTVIELRNINN